VREAAEEGVELCDMPLYLRGGVEDVSFGGESGWTLWWVGREDLGRRESG